MQIACPNCGAQFDASVALADEDARRFFGLISELPPVIIRPLVRYLGLFKPAKTRLSWSRMITITKELLPMIKAAHFKRNHQVHIAPVEIWAEAMDGLIETPPATLKRPLKTNGYLLEIVAGKCEKATAVSEAKGIQRQRNRQPKEDQAKADQARREQADAQMKKRMARYNKTAGIEA